MCSLCDGHEMLDALPQVHITCVLEYTTTPGVATSAEVRWVIGDHQ